MNYVLFLIVLATSPFNSFASSPGEKRECETRKLLSGPIFVEYTNDGDTVVLRASDGTLVHTRLLGIDTPETHYFGKNQGPWAFQAAQRLKELLPKGSQVEVKFDVVSCDSKARTLATIFSNGTNVNQTMLDEGWAVNYCVAPNFQDCEEFSRLTERNLSEKRGFLGDPGVELPYLFRAEDRPTGYEYYIGDIVSKVVVSSKEMDRVPIPNRVFFYSARKITPPYHL